MIEQREGLYVYTIFGVHISEHRAAADFAESDIGTHAVLPVVPECEPLAAAACAINVEQAFQPVPVLTNDGLESPSYYCHNI